MTKSELKKLLSVINEKTSCNMTLEDVYNEYLETDAEQLKPATRRGYISHWDNHICARFGCKKIGDIKRSDVAAAHREIGGAVGNRTIAFIGRLYSYAQQCEYVDYGCNPARGIRLHPLRARRRVADGGELGRLGDGVRRWGRSNVFSERQFASLVQIILLTGARVSEIAECKQSYIDIDRHVINLPDSKTGEKTIHLCEAAVEEIKKVIAMTGAGHIYLFPGRNMHESIRSVHHLWKQFRSANNISDDLHLHDLRRTFASIAISSNIPVEQISKLLGHSSTKVTEQVYAHMLDSAKKKAADDIGNAIAPLLAEG